MNTQKLESSSSIDDILTAKIVIRVEYTNATQTL
jgi:hypothetical protein